MSRFATKLVANLLKMVSNTNPTCLTNDVWTPTEGYRLRLLGCPRYLALHPPRRLVQGERHRTQPAQGWVNKQETKGGTLLYPQVWFCQYSGTPCYDRRGMEWTTKHAIEAILPTCPRFQSHCRMYFASPDRCNPLIANSFPTFRHCTPQLPSPPEAVLFLAIESEWRGNEGYVFCVSCSQWMVETLHCRFSISLPTQLPTRNGKFETLLSSPSYRFHDLFMSRWFAKYWNFRNFILSEEL